MGFLQQKQECLALCGLLLHKIQEDVLSVSTETCSSQFKTKSTVGIMLSGMVIDNMVAGGPAFNCGKLEKGDSILEVDLMPVSVDDLHRALLGDDIPGSTVSVTVKKANGNKVTVILKRIATEAIADRRRMFEMFTTLKERAIVDSDGFAAETIDDMINLWTKMLIADEVHDRKIVENVQIMQKDCLDMMQKLREKIEKLEIGDSMHENRAERAAPPSVDLYQMQQHCDQMQQQYEAELAKMLPKSQYDLLQNSLEKCEVELDRMKKLLEGSIPKSQYDLLQDSLKSCELEIERLKKMLEASVPKVQFDMKCDEVSGLVTETQRLQAEISRLKGIVDRLQALQEEADILRKQLEESSLVNSEVNTLKALLQSMVPKPQYDSLQDTVKNQLMEIERLNKVVEVSIPKARYDGKCDEAEQLREEVKRLQAEIERLKGASSRLDAALEEVGNLKSAREELLALRVALDGMVPKPRFESVQDNLARAELELDRLRKMLDTTVPKVKYDSKCDETNELAEQLKRLQAEIDRQKISLERLKSAHDEVASLRAELEDTQRAKDDLATLKTLMENMVSKTKYDASQDSLKLREMELDRLRKMLDATVPKVRFDTKCDEANQLLEEVKRLQAEIERQKLIIERLQKAQDDLSIAQARILELQSECKSKSSDLDMKRQDIERFESQVSSLLSKLSALVAKEELELAINDAKKARKELSVLKNLLATAGLGETETLESFVKRLSTMDMILVESLLDTIMGPPNIPLSDLIALLKDLKSPPARSCSELRRFLIVLNEYEPLTVEQLSQLRSILLGPPTISVAQLQELVRECADVDELRRLRSQIYDLSKQVEDSSNQASPPVFSAPFSEMFQGSLTLWLIEPSCEAIIYYTLDGSEPSMENYHGNGNSPLEVHVSDTCVVTAISVKPDGKCSIAVSQSFRAKAIERERERTRPSQERRVGGTGMLIQRLQDSSTGDWHVRVKELVPGGAAEASGQILAGDLLLAVDGQELRGKTTDMILQLIAGVEDSVVDLKMMRLNESFSEHQQNSEYSVNHDAGIVYSISLRRSAAGFNHDIRDGGATSPRNVAPTNKWSPAPVTFNPFGSQ